MSSSAGVSGELDLVGTLRFQDLEGGFWSLELETAIDGLGDHVVLGGYVPGPEFSDGMRVRVRAVAMPDAIGFRMAGPEVDVRELAPA